MSPGILCFWDVGHSCLNAVCSSVANDDFAGCPGSTAVSSANVANNPVAATSGFNTTLDSGLASVLEDIELSQVSVTSSSYSPVKKIIHKPRLGLSTDPKW